MTPVTETETETETEKTSVRDRPVPVTTHAPDEDVLTRVPEPVRRGYDLVAVIVLAGVAYWARRGTLPTDGLWLDDSWVATGAIHGKPSALLTVGSGHPAFTALLMAVHRLGSGSISSLGIPSLVAGVIGAPLLYVALRVTRFERSVSTILAAALAVAPIPVLYAGRVKGYTLDPVLMLMLIIAVPVAARRTWRWTTALAWVGAMVAIGAFSGFMLLSTAVATAVLVLHPCADRKIRLAALALQGAVQLSYLSIARANTDLATIEKLMEVGFDAHMELSADPVAMLQEFDKHFRRVVEVYPGGSGAWLTIAAVAGVAGLVLSGVRGRSRAECITGRFMLLVLGVAVAASFVDRFPFGPHNEAYPTFSPGGRNTLWMLPVMAFGLASIASRLRLLTRNIDPARLGFDLMLLIGAVALVVTQYEPAFPAPYQGSESSTRFVDETATSRDLIIITAGSTFSYANSTERPLRLVSTPDHMIGYAPEYDDPQILSTGHWTATPATPERIREAAKDRDRVLVVGSGVYSGQHFEEVAKALAPLDFRPEPTTHPFAWNAVQVWER